MDDILERFEKGLRSGREYTEYRERMRQRDARERQIKAIERQIKAIQAALNSYWSNPYKEHGIIEGFKEVDPSLAIILLKKGFIVGKGTDTEWAIISSAQAEP